MQYGRFFRLSSLILLAPLACSSPGARNHPNDGAAGDGNGGSGGNLDARPDGVSTWGGIFRDPDVGPDPETHFGGVADPSTPLPIVYPLDESMHPINLSDITFQWAAGDVNNVLYRIRLENDQGTYDFYVPCHDDHCIYKMPETEWLAVAAANHDGQVTATVSGTDGADGPVQSSPPITLRFSPEPVRGGLYYWSTKLPGTYRVLFGAKKSLPFITPNSDTNAFSCGGCHSVSRDGKTIAFTAGTGEGWLTVAPTDDPTMPSISHRPSAPGPLDSSLMALNPDGSRALVSYGGQLILRDTTDGGSTIATVDPSFLGDEGKGFFPEWSPDGKSIVVTLAYLQNATYDYDIATGQIAVLPYNDTAFGPVEIVAPSTDTDFNFYPSWSPDGKWIAFATAPVGSGSGGSYAGQALGHDSTYNEPQARLRLVASTGGTIYELGKGTVKAGVTSTWPKFTPFVQSRGDLLFVTFNSKMDYGYLLENSKASGPFSQRPQLWMFAIDLRKLGTGDPSTAPVWLPFQDLDQQNHLPYWTEVISCSGGTVAAACGDGETCTDGICTTP